MASFRSILLIFLFCLGTVSCKKTILPTRVEGQVRDRTTEQPVGGVTVYLIQKTSEFLSGSTGGKVIETAVTDPKGLFSFQHHDERGYTYYVEVKDDDYLGDGSSFTKITSGKKNKVIVRVNPKAYLKIHLKNTTNSETISLNYPCIFNCVYNGAQVDTFSEVFYVNGNLNNNIIWFVYKNGIDTRYEEKVYCPAIDTTIYNLNY